MLFTRIFRMKVFFVICVPAILLYQHLKWMYWIIICWPQESGDGKDGMKNLSGGIGILGRKIL